MGVGPNGYLYSVSKHRWTVAVRGDTWGLGFRVHRAEGEQTRSTFHPDSESVVEKHISSDLIFNLVPSLPY